VGYGVRMGEERKVYKVLVGMPEGKRPLGRPRRRWEDGIRMDIREIDWGGGGSVWWVQLTQDMDRWWDFVSTAMKTFGFWRHGISYSVSCIKTSLAICRERCRSLCIHF
jgi:hypothetical protein